MPAGFITVFRIAKNAVADSLHVSTKLVGTTGMRTKRHPRHTRAGAGYGHVFGLGLFGARFVGFGRLDNLAIVEALLDQGGVDIAVFRLRIAYDQRPIGLVGAALGEGARQTCGGLW